MLREISMYEDTCNKILKIQTENHQERFEQTQCNQDLQLNLRAPFSCD